MLLNEFLKEHKKVEQQQAKSISQQKANADHGCAEKSRPRKSKVSAQLEMSQPSKSGRG